MCGLCTVVRGRKCDDSMKCYQLPWLLFISQEEIHLDGRMGRVMET